ncbi:hypothetical protein NFI96_016420 [Prochilodus magdalenae]|nr:hypothetical protein NFI96_016420 [Prochilodus magdalenae]
MLAQMTPLYMTMSPPHYRNMTTMPHLTTVSTAMAAMKTWRGFLKKKDQMMKRLRRT